jgi:hypothetical protein
LAPRKRKRAQRQASGKGASAGARGRGSRASASGKGTRTGASGKDTRAGWRMERPMSRSERRNAEVRAGLTPLKPGERPWPILVSAGVAAVLALANLIAFAAGLKVSGKHPSAPGVIIFSVLMLVTAAGLWRVWYGAVLGFMALLAIICVVFALLLIEASNVLGAVVALAVAVGAGFLLYKLVRVLSRIQIPAYRRR